ncbi:hypothetical protein BP6252_08267 [Coleophoma cylindrospora]|uniref:NADPH--cytochrome P450 reductase n=1 Tax=Coleophoma cylindrospora TaxID=1849047 RepID=A0A3D8R5H3_9HELO|nr:hypothetical protein BP6252_08267 [Coleophoma cylindrospora]
MLPVSGLLPGSPADISPLLQRIEIDDIVVFPIFILLLFIFSSRGTLWAKPDPYEHVWYEKPQDTTEGAVRETRDIAAKLAETERSIAICWGSQSGTAEGFAHRLGREIRKRFGIKSIICDLSDYDGESFAGIPASKMAIFIVSTYGEGDPSDNATQFMNWLSTNREVHFTNLRYAAFGLGSRNYRLFNHVVDVLTQALAGLQATALLPVGKADESRGTTEEDFIEWKEALFNMFSNDLGFQEDSDSYTQSLKVVEDPSLDLIDLHRGEPFRTGASPNPLSHILPVLNSSLLLPTTDRNCLHMELDIREYPELKYRTGDHLTLWPSNSNIEVNRLLAVLGLDKSKDVPLLISSMDSFDHCNIPSPTTVAALFQYYLEVSAPVSRETVVALAQFAPTPQAAALLLQLGNSKQSWEAHCSEKWMTLGMLLEEVAGPEASVIWSNLPLSFVLESLPMMKPRYYSISSSSIVNPRCVSITVSISAPDIARPSGLATSYLKALTSSSTSATQQEYSFQGPNNLLANSKVFAQISASKFRLPTSPSTPIIMIAAGSGIAPFRAFIAERCRLATLGKQVGKMELYFGCRTSDEFLYKNELDDMGNNGMLEIVPAYSRSEINSWNGRMYVQDKMQARLPELLKLLLEENAAIYMCGSAAMARSAGTVIREAVRDHNAWDADRANEWVETVKRTRRWQEDVWG